MAEAKKVRHADALVALSFDDDSQCDRFLAALDSPPTVEVFGVDRVAGADGLTVAVAFSYTPRARTLTDARRCLAAAADACGVRPTVLHNPIGFTVEAIAGPNETTTSNAEDEAAVVHPDWSHATFMTRKVNRRSGSADVLEEVEVPLVGRPDSSWTGAFAREAARRRPLADYFYVHQSRTVRVVGVKPGVDRDEVRGVIDEIIEQINERRQSA